MTENMEVKKYEEQGLSLLETANGIKIHDQASREMAAGFVVECAKRIKIVEAELLPAKTAAHQTWKILCGQFDRLTGFFRDAKKIVDQEIGRDLMEQERIRAEEQRRLQELARQEEEKLRKQLLAQAAKAEDRGQTEKAQAKMEQAEAVFIPAPFVAPIIDNCQKVSGGGSVSGQKDIEVAITSKIALIKAIASGMIPDNLIDENMGNIKRYIKATSNRNIPGVSVKDIFITRTRVS
jgi:hypothetical protein